MSRIIAKSEINYNEYQICARKTMLDMLADIHGSY